MPGHQGVENFGRGLLVDVVGRALLRRQRDGWNGQQPLDHDPLLDDRLELVVEQIDGVALPGEELGNQFAGDLAGVAILDPLKEVDLLVPDGRGALAEVVQTLAPYAEQVERLAPLLPDKSFRRLYDIGVEGAAQPLVGGDHHQLNALFLPFFQQGMPPDLGAGHQAPDHLEDAAGVGPGSQDRLLGSPQLGGRDHLHGLGDLLGVAYRADPASNVQDVGHVPLRLRSSPAAPFRLRISG